MLTEFIPSTTKQHVVNHDPYINQTSIKQATHQDYDNISGTVDVSGLDKQTIKALRQIDQLNNDGATRLKELGKADELQKIDPSYVAPDALTHKFMSS